MTRVAATAAPDGAARLHVVAPADSVAEERAAAVADRAVDPVTSATTPPWAFGEVPVHASGPLLDTRLDGPGRALPPEWAPLAAGDVTDVRLHDDTSAADLTRRAGAEAVTVGHDIAFAPGRLEPHSRAGRRRIAHELAHVVQHTGRRDPGVAHRDGAGSVSTATTLAGLPEADRKRLQVLTTLPVEAVSSGQLAGAFQATSINAGADEVVADPSVPRAVATGLVNLAGDWSTGPTPELGPNQTVTVELDLTAHGGPKGLFRFTFVQPPPGTKGAKPRSRILIEGLGPATRPAGTHPPVAAKGHQPPPDPVRERMRAASITSGLTKPAEKQALREAIAQVPAAQLALVTGLRVERGGTYAPDPKAGGHYDQVTHRITLFDPAFSSTQVVFDDKGVATSFAARAIIHEIGHAVDLAPLRAAWARAERARGEMNAKAGDFSSKAEADAFAAARRASDAADAALGKARSRSGTRPVTTGGTTTYEIGTGHKGVKFREAVTADGKDVSTYAEKDWQESYAEAYSLYLTQPTLLERIRPATFHYLQSTLPR